MISSNDPVTPTELAREWRVSRPAVHARIMEGCFPNAFRVGSAWRIPRQDVNHYMDNQKKQHQDATGNTE